LVLILELKLVLLNALEDYNVLIFEYKR